MGAAVVDRSRGPGAHDEVGLPFPTGIVRRTIRLPQPSPEENPLASTSLVRTTARRGVVAWISITLVAAALAVIPAASVSAAVDACDTVSLTSPSALTVHVTITGCGDPGDAAFTVSADLTQDGTSDSIKAWGSASAVTTWVDEDLTVPARGAYTLTVSPFGSSGGADQVAQVVVSGGSVVTVSMPATHFRIGRMKGGAYPATVSWTNSSANAASSYEVQRSLDGAGYLPFAIKGGGTFSTTATLAPGHTYRFRVRGIASIPGPWREGPSQRPVGYSEASAKIAYGRTWSLGSRSEYWGGHTRFARASGATATLGFTGREAAIVVAVGPTRGSFDVIVDGVYRKTIKTYRTTAAFKQVLYVVQWPADGPHTVRIKVKGTAGHPRVDLDGFMALEPAPAT